MDVDVEALGLGRPAKRRSGEGVREGGKDREGGKLGREFKAKKAGGDLKKGGVDPYAYVPLGQAAKKGPGGRKGRVGIAKRA